MQWELFSVHSLEFGYLGSSSPKIHQLDMAKKKRFLMNFYFQNRTVALYYVWKTYCFHMVSVYDLLLSTAHNNGDFLRRDCNGTADHTSWRFALRSTVVWMKHWISPRVSWSVDWLLWRPLSVRLVSPCRVLCCFSAGFSLVFISSCALGIISLCRRAEKSWHIFSTASFALRSNTEFNCVWNIGTNQL